MASLELLCPPGLGFSPPYSHRREHYQTGRSLLASPCHGHRKKEPPFTDGRFDALAKCHLEGHRVREEGGVVGTKSAREANDPQEDLVVSRSKLGYV